MTTLSKRKVGTTKLDVTELGLGGAPMGGFRATIPDAEAVALIDAAYADGVRYFDTSPFYGYGRSELRMGAALREKPRDEYVLSTKIGRVLHAMKPGEKPSGRFPRKRPAGLRAGVRLHATMASCARSSIRTCGSAWRVSTSR